MSITSNGDASLAHFVELNRRYEEVSTRMLEADRESGELVKLYVTLRRLYEAPDRAGLIASVAEIIVSMIGCEEFAILEEDGSGETLALVESMGIEPADYRGIALATHPLGRLAAMGRVHLATEHAPAPLAVIPLMFGSRLAGAIVLVRLLPHRDPLENNDLEVLELLSMHAVAAARVAALRADAERHRGAPL